MSTRLDSYQDVAREVEENLLRFEEEVKQIVRHLVAPEKTGEFKGLTGALYGYMMGVFSRIDLLSCYWEGSTGQGGSKARRSQTVRMVEFMDKYLCSDSEANMVAVHLWRHKLMHTSRPRVVVRDGKRYYWLLNWGDSQMSREQHYKLTPSDGYRKLTIGMTYLVEDLVRTSQNYFLDVDGSQELRDRLSNVHAELQAQSIRS